MSDVPGQLPESIVINSNGNLIVRDDIVAPIGEVAIDLIGDHAQLAVSPSGSVSAPDEGNTAVQASGDGVEIANVGTISGALNGISSTSNNLTLGNRGTITSASRAIDLANGNNLTIFNKGNILGTGDQRNGTFHIDGDVDGATVFNRSRGVIDPGQGNLGDGISVQVGSSSEDAVSNDININNKNFISGRGQPAFDPSVGRLTENGSSGIRFFNGSGDAEAVVTGSLVNSGIIESEANVGFLGGVVVEDGVAFSGTINNRRSGTINGPQNGLYIGNADHDLNIINTGLITSGRRAVNLDGDNVSITNRGSILGTSDQRNGTLYVDGTGDNISIINSRRGVIDAGEGNSGSGVSIQVGTANGLGDGVDDTVLSATLRNTGTIQGRGDSNVPAGVRLFVGSGLEQSTFVGTIANGRSGAILSEDAAGILIEADVIFDGAIVNNGVITGGNGIAIDATGALGSITVTNRGDLNGDVLLGDGDDTFTQNADDAVTVDGGNGDDALSGGRGDDTLLGGGGNDAINGGRGDDVIAGGGGVDTLDGGDGNDTNSFQNIGAPVIADLATGSASYQPGVNTVFENFSNFENLEGSDNNDQLFGDGNANVLAGGDGDDILVGRGGSDTLLGEGGDDVLRAGGGNDSVDGGAGIDTVDFTDINVGAADPTAAGVTADLSTGTASYIAPSGALVQDQMSNIENITGSENDDTLTGDGENNLIAGGAGSDTLSGGEGDDVLRGDAIGDGEAIVVTVTNTLPDGGTFLTPIWFGFHDGENFDLFTLGEAASEGLERIAEDGSIEGIAAEFNQQVNGGGVDATIIGGAGVPGPIDPGEAASFTINVNPDEVGQGFFTWATMIIPSNDAFLAVPDDALADPIFDEDGNFIPLTIQRFGPDVLDAGVEVNNELDAAFLNQTARDTGLDENGVVAVHPGFNGSVGNPNATPVNILGGTTVSGAIIDPVVGDFTANLQQQLLQIDITQLAGGDDVLVGGLGNDVIDGGTGTDTADFSDIDVPVTILLDGNGDGTATRETGFSVAVADATVASLTTEQTAADIVEEAIAGNLYFNVHTNDFNGGEIRGQLETVVSDTTVSGVRTIVLAASLDAAQEPGPTSDSAAIGSATVTLVVDVDGTVTYSTDLSITGLASSDLLPVAGVSSIHLHNAPTGVNGPVILDVVQDAGGDINGIALSAPADTGDGNIFNELIETDTLISIESIIGSNDGDTIIASGAAGNTINGGGGDDVIAGGGGVDTLDGGDGNDTNSFQNIGAPVIADLATGSASYQPGVNTVFENFSNFENLEGSDNNDQLFGDGNANVLAGGDGDDILVGRGGGDTLLGEGGDDVLRAGGGNDSVDGGAGIDTVDFTDINVGAADPTAAGVTADLSTGTASYTAPSGALIQDQMSNIENITGSENDDTLTGDGENNLIAGGAGSDTLSGGEGDDVLRGDAIGDGEAIVVTVTNTLPDGGTFLTPIWFGFHDGENFDLFTLGEAASEGLERIAEDGSIEGIAAEFNQQVNGGGVDATIIGGAGVPGPIDPGEAASFTINVNPDEVGQGFFTWATMIIPSNDAFLAVPDDALADPIFDEDGNFIPLTIQRFGPDVLDAGVEVNNELDAAFLNQTARDTGLDENGVVAVHPGFNGSVGNPNATPVNILGGTTVSGAIIDPVVGDFTANLQQQLLQIDITQLAGGDDVLNGGAGDDVIDGGFGDDTLTGDSGSDTFIFAANSGTDVITDFSISDDVLSVGSLFGSAGLALNNAAQVSGGTLIDFGSSNSVLLENIDATDLTTSNFVV